MGINEDNLSSIYSGLKLLLFCKLDFVLVHVRFEDLP